MNYVFNIVTIIALVIPQNNGPINRIILFDDPKNNPLKRNIKVIHPTEKHISINIIT